jgi:uncharacterized protein YcnI
MKTQKLSRHVSVLALAAALFVPAIADAHVSIWPRESRAGTSERYTVRVPTEGKVATVAAEMDVPAGVVVSLVHVPQGWKQNIKRENDRIVSISWEMNIPPGEFMEFSFLARNPREGAEIVWTLRQKFADGTVSDWTKGERGTFPTAVVKLMPAPQ